ncbi:MAG: CAP domain-containing protein [Chloroflexota bacterium]
MQHLKQHLFVIFVAVLLVAAPRAHAQESAELLNRVNNLRTSLGLAPYSMNSALNAAAASHARWMAGTGQVSHTQPDGSTPRTRAAAAGYRSQFVAENIYGGGNASVNVAWNFWVNSGVHYRGLTNPNYQDVGIGIARGSGGGAYVMVFGNSSGSWNNQRISNTGSASAGEGAEAAAPPPPPSFVVGVDALGNIMHEIQPGDTLGDIALLYGYSWGDIPYMMEINELDDIGARELKVGAVMLVPPQDGTYTPTPGAPPTTATDEPEASENSDDNSTPEPTTDESEEGVWVEAVTWTPSPTLTPPPIVTLPPTRTPSPTPLVIAAADAGNDAPAEAQPARQIIQPNSRPVWLYIAVAVQVILIVGAGIELVLRQLRR